MFILKQVNLKSNGKLFFQPFGLFLIPGRFLLMRVKYQSCANIQLDNYCKSRLQRLRLSSKFCPLLIFDEEKKAKCLLFWILSLAGCRRNKCSIYIFTHPPKSHPVPVLREKIALLSNSHFFIPRYPTQFNFWNHFALLFDSNFFQ